MYTVARQTDTLAMGYVGGIGAMCGIMVSLPVSGGHINPSVTVAFALCKRLPANKVLHYLLGQYLGSFCAQVMVWTLYYEHINAFDGGLRSAVIGDPKATGKIFATFPPPTASLHTCIIDQIFCTSLLLIVVCAIIDPRGMKIPVYLQPFVISVLIAGLSTALGFNAGGMNPGKLCNCYEDSCVTEPKQLQQPETWLPVSSPSSRATDCRLLLHSAATTGMQSESWHRIQER